MSMASSFDAWTICWEEHPIQSRVDTLSAGLVATPPGFLHCLPQSALIPAERTRLASTAVREAPTGALSP